MARTTSVPPRSEPPGAETRDHLAHELQHWGHLLPGQGPMTTFVHHNTLHGLQHQPFEQAVAEGERLLGGRAYEPVERGRARYRAGRITDADLDAGFAARPELGPAEVVGTVGGRTVTDLAIRRLHLLHGVDALEPTTLRWALGTGGATHRCLSDVGEAARDRLLGTAQQELSGGLRRVGDGWTLADWLEALLDLPLADAVRDEVAANLEDGAGQPAGKPPADLLRGLGVPESRHHGYVAAVDAHCTGLPGADRDPDSTRRLWLAAEARVVRSIARRHFGVRGTLGGLEAYFAGDLERYGLTALWHACLAAFAIPDPLSPTHHLRLTEQDPGAAPERIAEGFRDIERWGGPPVPLDDGLRAAVRAVAQGELDRLEALVADVPEAAQRPAVREAAHAAWFVLADSGSGGLSRRGLEALEALEALHHPSASPPEAAAVSVSAVADQVRRRDPRRALGAFLDEVIAAEIDPVGVDRTHAELVRLLTGQDIVERVNRYMIRVCAAFLDQGQAAWHMPDRTLGFYEAWRRGAVHDRALDLEGSAGWRTTLADLPDRADDAVIALLGMLGVEPQDWGNYVGRVLVGLPGWAGMMNWRGTNPNLPRQQAQPTDLTQYLAVRLFVETAVVRESVQHVWGIEPGELSGHLRARAHEVWVRLETAAGRLPDFLADRARLAAGRGVGSAAWVELADEAWVWACEARGVDSPFTAHDHAWRLFRLAQLQGWSATEVRGLPATLRDRLLAILDGFPEAAHGPVWLAAFERHYREQILGALTANRGRGRWRTRDKRPTAQFVLCIDEREESMHRALDELDPEYETFGAGGFFGVAMDYSGLDDHDVTPLCPANLSPTSRVIEVGRPGTDTTLERRVGRRRWEDVFHNAYWETKRNAVSALFLTQLFGLVHGIPLFGKVLAPWRYTELAQAIERRLVPRPTTELTLDAEGATDHGKPVGFTVTEQADKVETQLRNIGMTHHFARLVVFCGHGSISVNNPHESAHDCGACGGKHGGPNGRAFAALANRPAVRDELARRGIEIPEDTHFVGAIHNTASDLNTTFDTDDIPADHLEEWRTLRANLDEASARSARERCRRFASAPKNVSPARSLRHVVGRSRDLSQVRPEWGHCTNAFAVVGRRCLTQGVFFDRRGFVISYDPTQDPTGGIVERILLSMGPVGAGINLEYYFSSVDNEVYGCDTKVPHNVSGLLGVMGGAASDLRTGLPKQMIEIHEPMRLLMVVESTTDVLGQIYGRQPAIAELLDNAWVHLVAMDPEDGTLTLFVPGVGFVAWDEHVPDLPVVGSSFDYYRGRTDFLTPALVGGS